MIEDTTRQSEAVAKLSKLIKDIQFAMLTTVDTDGTLHSRPMATQEQAFDGTLWFFTGRSTHKVKEINRDHHVSLAYADPSSNRYVAVSGVAQLVKDHEKARELWNPLLKAWFPKGLDDPDLCLLRVRPTSAEYWDAPGSKVAQLVGFVKSQITGQPAKVGDHAQINLHPST